MNDQLKTLQDVVNRLDQAGIAYMISGSTAMNYYAQPRMTRDIDIVIELDSGSCERLVSLVTPDFYIDEEAVREAIAAQSMFNAIHNELLVKVDFIIRKSSPYRLAEFARRRRVTVDNLELWVVSAEDLLLSKLVWAKDSHSEMQLKDVRNLIASVTNLDWRYTERWAKELLVAELLSRARE